ncbi:MAG: sugar ABC transporter substrate-binding protein [Chloroflexi bacterium]|nr:sugar ABC transporter substrate-binding protein [Chloroflexota bacterium]
MNKQGIRTDSGAVTRRGAIIGLGALAAGGVLAACGQAVQDASKESAGAKTAGAKVSGDLRFSFFGSIEEKAIWEKIAEQFVATTPTVKITPEHISSSYFTKIQTAIVAGDSADVILMEDKPTAGYAKKGFFRELDSFISADRTFKRDDYFPGLFDGLQYRGKLYGLPQHWLAHAILYNKEIFRKAGLKFPPTSARDTSWNWDALLETARKLTIRDGGKIGQWGLAHGGYSWTLWRMWVWQNGGDVVTKDLKKSVLDTPEAVEALQTFANLTHVHHVAPTPEERQTAGASSNDQLFYEGKTAMISSAPYFHNLRNRIKDFEWDVAVPAMRKRRATPLWPDSISMWSGTKAPEASWQFLRYVVGPEGQKTITELGRGVPVLKSAANSPAFLQEQKDPKSVRMYLDVPQFGVVTQYTSMWTEIEQANREELEPVFLGKRSAKDAVSSLVPRLNQLLQQAEMG